MSYFEHIYKLDTLPSRARAVYLYLADRADKDGGCWPAVGTIAHDMGLSRSTVKRALEDLEQADLLVKSPRLRENGSRSSNLLTLQK